MIQYVFSIMGETDPFHNFFFSVSRLIEFKVNGLTKHYQNSEPVWKKGFRFFSVVQSHEMRYSAQ